MKKKIKMLLLFISLFIIGYKPCYAASASIKASNTSITKGSSVTITATISSDSPLVSIEGTLKCSGAGVSRGLDLSFDDSSNSLYSKAYSMTVSPSSSGTLTCSVEGARLTEMSKDTWQNISNKNINITVNEPQKITPKTYSSNNYLIDLSIENYELDKKFDKETLEYNVELPNGTETIKIVAKTENSSASASGIGEVSVTEGINKIEIKVTAENGNVRTYIINAKVLELDPIEIQLNNKIYTVVRKEDNLDLIEGYEKTTTKINDEDVLAFHNEITNYTLVLLKDEEGKEDYYLYQNNKYTPYKEYNFGGVRLYLIEKKQPDNFITSEYKINDETVKAYQLNTSSKNTTYALSDKEISNYYLVYGMNINTGKENYYLIDKIENTAIRYSDEISAYFLDTNLSDNTIDYKTYFFIALGCFGLTIVILGLNLLKNNKKKNKFKD